MTIATSLEQLNYAGPDGSIWTGQHRQVITGVASTATRILLPKDSGALCIFDQAAGLQYTLPAPSTLQIGAFFEFGTLVSVTSNSAKVLTDATTTFLVGSISIQTIATVTPAGFSANGTTIRSVNGNGTTTGGLIGDGFRVTLINTTQWYVTGLMIGSGTLATPFATT